MVSTHKKRLPSQLDECDQDKIIGNTMSDRLGNATGNEGTIDQELIVGNSDSNPAVNVNLVNVKTLERCFNEKIDREMGNIVALTKTGI